MELTASDRVLIASTLTKYFTPEQIEAHGLADRPVDRNFRTQLAELDMNFFCHFYLPHHFNLPNAPLHDEFAQDMNELMGTSGRAYYANAWPRDHGKTTWANLGLPMWVVYFRKRRYILLLADSHDQAKGHLATIKKEVESNERLLEDFGDLRGSKWQEEHIETANECCLEALGTRMKIRGRKFRQFRPDLMIFDDLENLISVQSERGRELQREWFFRSALKAGSPDTKYVCQGTLLHYDALLIHVLANPLFRSRKYKAVLQFAKRRDLWDIWQGILMNPADPDSNAHAQTFFDERREEMMEGAVVLWPQRYPYYELMKIRAIEGTASFAGEFQNEPFSEEDLFFDKIGHFRREWRDGEIWLIPLGRGVQVPQSACAIFGFLDPSLGRTPSSHPSAIIVLAKAPTGQMFVLEADITRRLPDVIIHDIIEWARIYPFARFGLEAHSFQVLLGPDLRDAAQQANVYLDVMPLPVVGNKELRIQSLQAPLQNEYILLEQGKQWELHKQLQEWPMAASDDGPDALEGAYKLARDYIGGDDPGMITGETYQYGVPQGQQAETEVEVPTVCPVCRGMSEHCPECKGLGIVTQKESQWYPRIATT